VLSSSFTPAPLAQLKMLSFLALVSLAASVSAARIPRRVACPDGVNTATNGPSPHRTKLQRLHVILSSCLLRVLLLEGRSDDQPVR
jgi:hypothetical protein